jgi:hypothetical protein
MQLVPSSVDEKTPSTGSTLMYVEDRTATNFRNFLDIGGKTRFRELGQLIYNSYLIFSFSSSKPSFWRVEK